ncbi:MAG: SAF domain-containing protein [Actinomycetes bacterium]
MTVRGERWSTTGWLRELRRAAVWHRRLLVAGLLAASVAFALQALSPGPPSSVDVLVAAKDLGGGTSLSPGDVRLRAIAVATVPRGSLRHEGDATGRTLAAPARAGEVITDVRLVGRSTLASYGEAVVAAPVRIADATSVRLLRAGDVIDVLAAGAATDGAVTARLVASAVPIITIPHDGGSLLGSHDVGAGALLVVATSSDTAGRLAAAAVTDRLSVVIRAR